jgi:hypothetical protein
MLGGIWGWLVKPLFEHLGEHLVLDWLFSKIWVVAMGLVWLFSKIWVGMVLALAVILVVVLIAWLVDALR